MLKTKIKASSITNLTDARYFAAWEVEWLGFNLESGNESFISPRTAKTIQEWVDGVKTVGEFGLPTEKEVRSALEFLDLDSIQLGMFADLSLVQSLADLTIFKEVVIDKETTPAFLENHLESFAPFCNYFLFNFDKNGVSWADLVAYFPNLKDCVENLGLKFPTLLSISANPNDLDEILENINIVGLNLKGGAEEKVGFKSFDDLDEIFEALEILV